ncbi:MAG TPA: flagellar hook-associated protein FlgK [Croceibacterium sp.]|nr:flagellar hook-associated protein FlgK [Croceibacterium sp.]
MASDLLSIAASGARAARSALDVTAQNIANASTEGYVRRTAVMEEVAVAGGLLRNGDISLSGVRVGGIDRNADMFRQAEVRRTGSDLARATTELSGLKNVENALEKSGVYESIVEFEAALQQLSSDPTNPSLRAAALGAADAMAGKFNIAASGLEAAGEGLRFDAAASVDDANTIAQELARVNLKLARAGEGSSDKATLLDQRDMLLERMSGIVDIKTSFGADGAVTVTTGGQTMVTGGVAGTLASATAADGTLNFTLDGTAITPGGGKLAGASLALTEVASARTRLDTLADGIASTINTAQANGVALDGSTGQPIFGGTGAVGMTVVMSGGSGLATAPAGSAAGSRDAGNLSAMRQALEGSGAAQGMSTLLFDVSSHIAGRTVTHDALSAIASAARTELDQMAGVDLDTEAANLMRFQQAFQASGRAMQVASDIFQTLMGIG